MRTKLILLLKTCFIVKLKLKITYLNRAILLVLTLLLQKVRSKFL